MQLVEVEWLDACFVFDVDEPVSPPQAFTVGYLYEQTMDYVAIAAEWFPHDKSVRALTVIPMGCVVRIRNL